MNRTKTLPTPKIPNPYKSKCPFDFVIAYEDTATRNRVYNLYDHLAQQLFEEFDFRGVWYKFDFLSNSTVRDTAVQEAAEAQMIVLSLRQGNSLPGHVIDWIDGWTSKRTPQKSALVTLVAGDDPCAHIVCPIQQYLRKTARRVGMDFFAHNFDFPGLPRKAVARPTRPAGELPASFLEDAPYRSGMASHWGINE